VSQKPNDYKEIHISNVDYTKLAVTSTHYEVYKNPVYVGGYQLGGKYGLTISFAEKPCWFHRKMMKLFLGWEWIDDKR
jgi:hypothetical protein